MTPTMTLTMTMPPLLGQLNGVGGEPWSQDRRDELWAQWHAGTLQEVEFSAVVYRTGPNANHVRFAPEALPAFAASFVGQPFLRNHATEDIGARDGTILSSVLVGAMTLDADALVNGQEIQQTIRITTRRGIRNLLEGVIDRFSIGWSYAGVECSICGADWLRCEHWPGQRYVLGETRSEVCELLFMGPVGKETSAVNAPAVPGTRILDRLCSVKEATCMNERMSEQPGTAQRSFYLPNGTLYNAPPASGTLYNAPAVPEAPQSQVAQWQPRLVDDLIEASGLTPAGKAVVRMACVGKDAEFVTQMIAAQRQVGHSGNGGDEAHPVRGIRPISNSMMSTPEDRVQGALNWLFGARDEPTPPPSLRSIRDLYVAITGDGEWHGVFRPEWSQLSAASTTTLAGMVVNALNKVVMMHYDNLATYRWYEQIVEVIPHDGTTHDVQLILVDGLANLPTVDEGAAYTEASVGDSKESFAFTKRGHYVGITLETLRRGNLQRIQAIPRELVKASIRTRSAAIAAIFTQNSGAGPTLADDSTALFHADHGNWDTGAFSSSEWAGARQRIWAQSVPGTGSPLALWPTYCLVPIELYDTALTEFGYGTGDVGKPNSGAANQTVNPYGNARPGDPRPIPVAVPEWTDATDWAYLVDPRLHPVIHMGYANAPQGGSHPLPEIFEVTSESSGLMFSNDTLPVKIRDWWGYGVSTHVGIGKNNVAG